MHGDPASHVGNTVTASFAGVDGHLLMIGLDLEGIAVSTGAACDAGAAEPSAVLLALGHTEAAQASIRMSLCDTNTPAEIDEVLAVLPVLIARQRETRGS